MLSQKGERLPHHYLTIQKFSGDTAVLTVLRDGKEIDVNMIVDEIPHLVPLHLYELPHTPTYFIFGGLVFLPLSRPFLFAYYGSNWYSDAPLHLSNKATVEYKQTADEQVIVLSHVLSNEINVGYEGCACRMLLAVDNVEVKNMTDLCRYIDSTRQDFIRFDLYKDSVIVLEVSKARESLSDTLKTHCIPVDRSPDLEIKRRESLILEKDAKKEVLREVDEQKDKETTTFESTKSKTTVGS
ncbi:hypothetical protein RFI_19299 [Reticulomyxa filosa]|uniref:Protease Do-like PDZ domain-containing protein n=1 Tax=Reticulomyxa filosa TaxID=46433 RepID=X6MVZ4_RETFI|nr:hypothetical protein RFI_19299 [Reticulomyxa filosa]|eukprot:ETO17994.1 hypothetical protein RFI_19299 [Reticulomyxa filosa]